MRRIDRKQPTVGRLCIGQPPTGGGRSLGCRYPQNKGISLDFRGFVRFVFCGYRLVCLELNCGYRLVCDLPPFLAKRLTDTLSPDGDVIGQYAACRIDALWFFGLMCGTVVLLIVLSACGFLDCCFVFMHLLLFVSCCG